MRSRRHRGNAARGMGRCRALQLLRLWWSERGNHPGESAMSAAVTGWALRTPLGNDSATFMRRLLAGERAARPNPELEHESSACKIIASIPGLPDCTAHRRFLGRLELFAIDVGVEAFSGRGVDGARLRLFAATGG